MSDSNPFVQLERFRELIREFRFEELGEALDSLSGKKRDPAYLPFEAMVQIQRRDIKAARKTLRKALLHQIAYRPGSLVDLAGVFLLTGERGAAETLLAKALEVEPGHVMALARMGYCKMSAGDNEEALRFLAQACSKDRDNLGILSNYVFLLLRADRLEEIQGLLDHARRHPIFRSYLERFSTYRQSEDLAPHERRQFDLCEKFQNMQLDLWVKTGKLAEAEAWLDGLDTKAGDDNDTALHWRQIYALVLSGHDLHEQAEQVLREELGKREDHVGLLRQLAELARLQGRSFSAMNLLKRALKRDEDNVSLWAHLSQTALYHFEPQAREAAEKAMELSRKLEPGDNLPQGQVQALQMQARHALAQVESYEGNYDAAQVLFDENIAADPYHVPTLQALGHQKMQIGQIEEAIGLFEKIKTLDPVQGESMLINAHHFPEDEETLLKLERAARMPSMEGRVRSGLLLQLASAWEDKKDYEKAIELAHEGNGASAKFLHYDALKHKDRCDRIRQRFTREFFDHRKEVGHDSELPVYVVGMPRSGTTLIEQILGSHPSVCGAGELGLIPGTVQKLSVWERSLGSGREYPECADDLTPYEANGMAEGILKELREYDKKALRVVDKLPHNFEHIGLIKLLFPKARIVSVQRDPRDVAISNYFTNYQARHGGMGFAYDLGDIGQQLADHHALLAHWRDVFGDEILEVQYEEVVDDVEKSARRMLGYIGVEWDPVVLDFDKLDRPVKTASVWQVRQPIYSSSKEKWRRYKDHLTPLLKGCASRRERRLLPPKITLPVPGLFTDGVAHYKKNRLDEAETCFKKMLHHNPDHAAAKYMVGLVALSKGRLGLGIEYLEQAVEIHPYRKEWRDNLAKAYELNGQGDKAKVLEEKYSRKNVGVEVEDIAITDAPIV